MSAPTPVQQPRRGTLGCLGVFSIPFLACFTLVNGLVLLYVNPDWFDRHVALWRPPVLEPEALAAAPGGEGLVPEAIRPPRRIAESKETSDGARLAQFAAVETSYDPSSGATIETTDRGRFSFPPGSIRGRTTVRAVPLLEPSPRWEGGFRPVGPTYKIYVGENEHYSFMRPVQVTLPYDPEACEGKRPAIHVNATGDWEPVPSTVDPASRTVSARISHCSSVSNGVSWIKKKGSKGFAWVKKQGSNAASWSWRTTKDGAFWVGTTVGGSVKGGYYWMTGGESTHEAGGFTIYYSTSGAAAVPPDSGPDKFPLDAPKSKGNVPSFVFLLGKELVFAHENRADIGVAGEYTGDVYVVASSSFGETPAGGPIMIANDWKVNRPNTPSGKAWQPAAQLDANLRATAVHEYIHVMQYDVYQGTMLDERWWMEMSAPYLADRFWEKKGRPTNMVHDFYMSTENSNFISEPITRTSDSEHNYCYGSLLFWLDRVHDGAGWRVTQKMLKTTYPTEESFFSLVEAETGLPAGEFIENFAMDYFYRDKWKGEITPLDFYSKSAQRQANRQSLAGYKTGFPVLTNFPQGSRVSSSWIPTAIFPYASADVPALTPLTSMALLVHVERLSEFQKAKLVFEIAGGAGVSDPNLSLQAFADEVGSSLPPPGQPSLPTKITGKFHVVENVMSPGEGDEVYPDHAAIIMTNRSKTSTTAPFKVRRWALLRPSFIQYRREHPAHPPSISGPPGEWRLTWDATALTQDPAARKFLKGWRVYNRRLGDPEFPEKPLVELPLANTLKGATAESVVTVPAAGGFDQDYVFTVTLFDIYGNESYPAVAEETDPFEGRWEGTVKLVEGSVTKPLKDFIAWYIDLMEKDQQEYLKTISDPAERQRENQAWIQQKNKLIEPAAKAVGETLTYGQFLLRLGFPLSFEIKRVKGEYFFAIRSMMGMSPVETEPTEHTFGKVNMQEFFATGGAPSVPLERVGRQRLKFSASQLSKADGQLADPIPIYLRLHRENVISDEYRFQRRTITVDMAKGGQNNVVVEPFKVKWEFNRVTYSEGPETGPWWQKLF